MGAKRHEHFFGRPESEGDEESNRFDAVEDDRGKCWVYIAANDKWIPRNSYEDALAFAQMLAQW